MKIKIEAEKGCIPHSPREGDAAVDLKSAENTTIKAGEQKIISSGLKIAIPEGFVGLIWDRSGMAAKQELHCLAGVIDPNYRGTIGIILKNLGKKDFNIEKGMRIAQLLIQPCIKPEFIEEKLNETNRNNAGFGSSGFN